MHLNICGRPCSHNDIARCALQCLRLESMPELVPLGKQGVGPRCLEHRQLEAQGPAGAIARGCIRQLDNLQAVAGARKSSGLVV